MPIQHKKKYGVYHWDTFDNETILLYQSVSLDKCVEFVDKKYADRLRQDGADRVEVVDDKGKIVRSWNVG